MHFSSLPYSRLLPLSNDEQGFRNGPILKLGSSWGPKNWGNPVPSEHDICDFTGVRARNAMSRPQIKGLDPS